MSRKDDQNDEILQFVRFWEDRTGKRPAELIFDSKLTTYGNLNRLHQAGIAFITLRRRSRRMLLEARNTPLSAWRRVELEEFPASIKPLGSWIPQSPFRTIRDRSGSW